ncbi:MAG: hypothetical protein AAB116_07665 [Candidatus Poribacteria bacterium]
MSLKEKLEQSPVWIMITIAVGGFIFGVTSTMGIIKIIFQDQSNKTSTIEKLSQIPAWAMIITLSIGFVIGVGVMLIYQQHQNKMQISKSYEKPLQFSAFMIVILFIGFAIGFAVMPIHQRYKQISQSHYKGNIKIFNTGNPIPLGFEQIKIEMRLSVLQSIFPEGSFFTNSYIVNIKDNPIIHAIICDIKYDDEKMNDGTITKLTYLLNGSAAREYLIEQALSAFGPENAMSKQRGNILEWKNVEGFHINIDRDSYYVESAK